MTSEKNLARREFLRYVTIAGIAVPVIPGMSFFNVAQAAVNSGQGEIFRFPEDRSNLAASELVHLPAVTLPPVVEDGAQAPIVVEMDHPMDDDHYIKSIQILNYSDPVVIKGKFYFTPLNGEVYFGSQIRLSGGESTVWVIAECSQHGRFAVSKTVKVAAGGC